MRRKACFIALVVGAFFAVGMACSNQGEGDRCEVGNNNEDCQNGLVCYEALKLNGTPNSDRCCPQDRSQATHPICQTPVTVVQDAQTPADTGPAPVVDAGTDDADAADTDADASDQ